MCGHLEVLVKFQGNLWSPGLLRCYLSGSFVVVSSRERPMEGLGWWIVLNLGVSALGHW